MLSSILCKLGPWITIVGFCCAVIVGTSDWAMASAIIALLMAIPGGFFGYKAWDWDISPIGLAFMSASDILNNKFVSIIVWAVRFIFLTYIFILPLLMMFY